MDTLIYSLLLELCKELKVDTNIQLEKNQEMINSVKRFIITNRESILSKTSLVETKIYTSTPIVCNKINENVWNILLKLCDCFFIRQKYMNDMINTVKPDNTVEKEFTKNISGFIEKNSLIENNSIKVEYKDLKDLVRYQDLKSGKIKLEEVCKIYSSVLENAEQTARTQNSNEFSQEKLKKLKEDLEKLKNLKL